MLEQKFKDKNIDRREFIKKAGILGSGLALSSLINSCVKLDFYPYIGPNGYKFKKDLNANDDLFFCKEYMGFDHLPLTMPHAWWLVENSDFEIGSPGGIGHTYSLFNVDKGIFLEWIGGSLSYMTTFKGWTGKIEPVGLKLFDDISVFQSIYPDAKMGHSYSTNDEVWCATTDFTDYKGILRKSDDVMYASSLLAQLDKNKKIKYLQVGVGLVRSAEKNFSVSPEYFLEHTLPK